MKAVDLTGETKKSTTPIWVIVVLSIIGFALSWFSPISYANSDAWGSLLTAQTIIQEQTIRLEGYGDEYVDSLAYRAIRIGDHAYYYYPKGPSIVAIPFVAVANLLGMDMLEKKDDAVMQRFLAAMSVGVSMLLVFSICGYYLTGNWRIIATVILVLGSVIVSTMGTAYWNMSCVVLIQLWLMRHLIRVEKGVVEKVDPWITGGLLTFAFICRPTAAVFIVCVFGYLFWKDWKGLIKTASTSLVLLFIFFGHSLWEYGTVLPPNYRQGQAMGGNDFWTGMQGVLISPSRGLFVYSPFLLVILLGLFYYRKKVLRSPLIWMGLVWVVVHTVLVANWAIWWGGACFGYRLLGDSYVGMLVVTVIVLSWMVLGNRKLERIGRVSFGIFGLVAILINTLQGMYNRYPHYWYSYPEPGNAEGVLFDWSYPYFLGNKWQDRERKDALAQTYGAEAEASRSLEFTRSNVDFELGYGWSKPEGEEGAQFVWSEGKQSEIYVNESALSDSGRRKVESIALKLQPFRDQRGWFEVNGQKVLAFSTGEGEAPKDYVLPIRGGDTEEGIEITIHFDSPKRPKDYYTDSEDTRELGFSMYAIHVNESE